MHHLIDRDGATLPRPADLSRFRFMRILDVGGKAYHWRMTVVSALKLMILLLWVMNL